MSDAEFHRRRRQEYLEWKKRYERRWGWLANLVAGLIITGFQILRSYLKFVFNMLSQGTHGFFFLIILHLMVLTFLATAI